MTTGFSIVDAARYAKRDMHRDTERTWPNIDIDAQD